jgi:hypothetical protein
MLFSYCFIVVVSIYRGEMETISLFLFKMRISLSLLFSRIHIQAHLLFCASHAPGVMKELSHLSAKRRAEVMLCIMCVFLCVCVK